jgi:hypothetical protein
MSNNSRARRLRQINVATEAQPVVLVAAAKWWPLSARMAVALHRHGCEVRALCPTGHPLRHVSGIRDIYRYRGLDSIASLRRAIDQCRPDLIVPCDDGVVAQLHALHALDPALRPLIEKSLGDPAGFTVIERRYEFLSTAIELGIQVPRTKKIDSVEDLAAWHSHSPAMSVIKSDGECGGNGVRMSRSLDESLAAWHELRRPFSRATAWKRLIVDRDPLAMWLPNYYRNRGVTAQEFISGRPANSMLISWQGKVLALVSVAVVATEGPTGAATIVRVIDNEQMKRAAELVVARLNLSGFYGLDFILETATAVPHLIEMNPRCTQLGHIEFASEGCLAGVLGAVLRGEPRPEVRNPVPGQTIALFPQALTAGAACRPHIDASYLDVPHDEPQLVRELMLKSWPQRRWAARIYHAFKPLERAEPVLFEASS